MQTSTLVARNLRWYWRTNLAVVCGVAVAVAVLAGALVVGESVRASLRDLVIERLGKTDTVVTATHFFRDQLASPLQGTPIITLEGLVTHQSSGRRASKIQVYGIDERFWKFHGREARKQGPRDLLMSTALAGELAAKTGDVILLRLEKPSEIPQESLHGRREDSGRTIRFTMRGALAAADLGDFSLYAQQGSIRAIFVPLSRLQAELGQENRVNTMLLPRLNSVDQLLSTSVRLEDLDLKVRVIEPRKAIQVESSSTLLNDSVIAAIKRAADQLNLRQEPVLTYLVNSVRTASRSIPYSLVSAVDLPQLKSANGIVLNDWAARDLGVKASDSVTLEYYVWKMEGRLTTEAAKFEVAAVVPVTGAVGDRDFAPEYPGISGSDSLRDWDPPFPMDLGKIRPVDEDYWHKYRTIPKAYIALTRGQELWESRFGKLTSVRLFPPEGSDLEKTRDNFRGRLKGQLHPEGFTILPVRAQALEASAGSTDFGEYFSYFSFFLMISALMLTGLFFKLGVEQRLREIGLLRTMGFSQGKVRSIFLTEGLLLSLAGSLLGVAGAVGYAALIMYGLRTWWVDAVGTSLLSLHASPEALAAGGVGGVLMALISIALSLRGLKHITPKTMLGGPSAPSYSPKKSRVLPGVCAVSAVAGFGLLAAGAMGQIPQAGAFFGAGALLLVSLLSLARIRLGGADSRAITGTGLLAIAGLGMRNASDRPGRSTLSIALIASAAFLLVSLDAFRRTPGQETLDRHSGNGGYPLLADSLLPLYHDLNTPEGRDNFNLRRPELEGLQFVSFRLRPGDDTSCLNLYQPTNPRILGAPRSFLREGRFAFQDTLTKTDSPWLLLDAPPADGAIPAIADANSMMYVLHKKLGDEVLIPTNPPAPAIRLRLVASLSDSIFQRELIISERNFINIFPRNEGYRFFLIEGPAAKLAPASGILEEALSDSGFDVVGTGERLAQFHRVENTYLSTFQALGAMGLLIGTLGLGVVLLRNALERRRELAVLSAVGYDARHLGWMMLAETLLLLVFGLAAGFVCALLAVAPALRERGSAVSPGSLALLLGVVFLTGFLASLVSTAVALRTPLLEALRSE